MYTKGGKLLTLKNFRQKSCVLDNPKKGVLRFKKKKSTNIKLLVEYL